MPACRDTLLYRGPWDSTLAQRRVPRGRRLPPSTVDKRSSTSHIPREGRGCGKMEKRSLAHTYPHSHTNTCTVTQTHAHDVPKTRFRAYTHARAHEHTRTQAHAGIQMHAHTTCSTTGTHKYTNTYIRAYTQSFCRGKYYSKAKIASTCSRRSFTRVALPICFV